MLEILSIKGTEHIKTYPGGKNEKYSR
jgi:hypothetical protein